MEEIKQTAENIKEEFEKLIDSLSNENYNNWVMNWFDRNLIFEIYNNWDIETKKEEIKILRSLVEGDLSLLNYN